MGRSESSLNVHGRTAAGFQHSVPRPSPLHGVQKSTESKIPVHPLSGSSNQAAFGRSLSASSSLGRMWMGSAFGVFGHKSSAGTIFLGTRHSIISGRQFRIFLPPQCWIARGEWQKDPVLTTDGARQTVWHSLVELTEWRIDHTNGMNPVLNSTEISRWSGYDKERLRRSDRLVYE
jgi:hypothetical protein